MVQGQNHTNASEEISVSGVAAIPGFARGLGLSKLLLVVVVWECRRLESRILLTNLYKRSEHRPAAELRYIIDLTDRYQIQNLQIGYVFNLEPYYF